MRATLRRRGFLLVGPTQQLFVSKEEHVESEKLELISEENINRDPSLHPVEAIDIQTVELFGKDWCGPIDLSEAGVAALGTWDETYAKQALQESFAKAAEIIRTTGELGNTSALRESAENVA